MGMLGLLLAALIIGALVMLQLRGQAPTNQPAEPVREAAAAAKVDASNYANLLKDVKTRTDAASQKEAARIQDLQQPQDGQ
jgi:hypothetical protein